MSLLQYEIISHSSLQHYLHYDSSSNELTVLLEPHPPSLPETQREKEKEGEKEDKEKERMIMEEEKSKVVCESNNSLDTINEEEGSEITQLKVPVESS